MKRAWRIPHFLLLAYGFWGRVSDYAGLQESLTLNTKWWGIEEITWEPNEVNAADVCEVVKKYLQTGELMTAWESKVHSLLESKMKRA